MYKILIVDDEKELRETSAELLRLEGYEVVTAADGDDALIKAKNKNFDLALVDLVLPGKMNGLDIINKLRIQSISTYIIAFTGFSGQNFSQKALKAGANEFVTKPGLAKNLVDNINKFFNKDSQPMPSAPKARVPELPITDAYESDTIFNFIPGIFLNMPDQNIKEILAMGKRKTIAAGDNFIMDATRELVIIKKGALSCWYRNSVIGFMKSGDSIGESSVFLSGQTNFMLLLKSDAEFEVIIINKKDFSQYLQTNKSLALRYAANTILGMSKKFMVTCERVARMNEEVRQLKTPVDGVLY